MLLLIAFFVKHVVTKRIARLPVLLLTSGENCQCPYKARKLTNVANHTQVMPAWQSLGFLSLKLTRLRFAVNRRALWLR